MRQSLISQLKNRFQGKKVLVVGLGIQGGGIGLVQFFSTLGARVTASDVKSPAQLQTAINQLESYPVVFRFGPHQEADFLDSDIIFTGPSVKWDLPELIAARKKHIPIETEVAFFASLCPATIIGVTGTRGKSTTSSMIYQVLKAARKDVFLAGNVSGQSTISLLKRVSRDSLVVLELSSWQLAGFHRKRISPPVAVFTNLYPDHMNYYQAVDAYLYDKKAIYWYQTPSDTLIMNRSLISIIPPEEVKGKRLLFSAADFTEPLHDLKGSHNQENAAAALATLNQLKIATKFSRQHLLDFVGLPNRQELIGENETVKIINDTTSTTPTATIKAIDSFSDRNIILILGGNSKNLPVTDLLEKLAQVEKIVLLAGSFTDQILPQLKQLYPNKISPVFNNLKLAIEEAYRLSLRSKGFSYLLFSPGATSFAMFNNEFHRGQEFVKISKALLSK